MPSECHKMSYRDPFNMSLSLVLLLLMLNEVHPLPAGSSDTAAVTIAANSVEETNKLPDTDTETVASIDPGLDSDNDTHLAPPERNETQETTTPGDNVASASSNEPVAIYANGLITPEAFQQYLNQYGGAAGLAPLAAAYPAPIAGAPGIYPYPGPIMVQTGYEGFLVPTSPPSSDSGVDATTTVAAAPTSSMNPLIAFASRLLPTILMSTVFRIIAVVLSAVGAILFGGAIASSLCRITPICEIPKLAVNYLRTGGAQDVGRMLAEEITPERVRRTAEFVHNAIRKYRQMQKVAQIELKEE